MLILVRQSAQDASSFELEFIWSGCKQVPFSVDFGSQLLNLACKDASDRRAPKLVLVRSSSQCATDCGCPG